MVVTRAPVDALAKLLARACSEKQPVLLLCESSVVDTYLTYQRAARVDCKKALLEAALWKTKSAAEVRAEARAELARALRGGSELSHSSMLLWLHLSTCAFALNGLCDDAAGVPAEIFKPGYGLESAVRHGLLDRYDAEWLAESRGFEQHFGVVLTSNLSLEDARAHLVNSIPFFTEMQVIVVEADPDPVPAPQPPPPGQGTRWRESRPPAGDLAAVLEALYSGDECKLQRSVSAAVSNKANGTNPYTEEEELARTASAASEKGPALRVQRVRYDLSANVREHHSDEWTTFELTDWVELDQVWVELASNADEDWTELDAELAELQAHRPLVEPQAA